MESVIDPPVFGLFLLVMLVTVYAVWLRLQLKRKEGQSLVYQLRCEHLEAEVTQKSLVLSALETSFAALRDEHSDLQREYTVLHTRFGELQRTSAEKIKLLEEAKTALSTQFESLANRIFDEKTKRFDASQQQQMTMMLTPFREQIEQFAKSTQERYMHEAKERHLLKDEIVRLKSMNERLSEDALNLANALRGENKTQGSWGEMVLSRILEESGLREGHEYSAQGSYRDELGKLLRPDVVVKLPRGKQVVIDSKVSLVAFERFMNAQEPEAKAHALKAHIQSLHAHIKGLGAKRYENLPEIDTLDFVLLFMPIEGAFLLALEQDSTFFKTAYEHNIIVVGPSTLLATLRTIEHAWRSERQNRNTQEIVKLAEGMYDKFVLFVEEMQRLGEQLGRSQESYERAMNRLSAGKGNLILRAEKIRELGIKPKKALPIETEEGV